MESTELNKLKSFFSTKVKFAFVFGSANSRYFNKNSDIDIAIWLNNHPQSIEDIYIIKNDAEKCIDFKHDIDIIILNNADTIITNQIITKGKLIINNDPDFTDKFIITSQSKYSDFKYWRFNLENELKNKII